MRWGLNIVTRFYWRPCVLPLDSSIVTRLGLSSSLYHHHYNDVIASQITSFTSVYSIIYSDADQRKYQSSSASLAIVRWIHQGPVNSPHKWPVARKMFPFDDVIMMDLLAIIPYDTLGCHAKHIILSASTHSQFNLFRYVVMIKFWLHKINLLKKHAAVRCRYNAVQYHTILHTSVQWLRQNMNYRLNTQNMNKPAAFNDTALYFRPLSYSINVVLPFLINNMLSCAKHIENHFWVSRIISRMLVISIKYLTCVECRLTYLHRKVLWLSCQLLRVFYSRIQSKGYLLWAR